MVVVNPLPLTLVVSPAGSATAEWVDPLTRLVIQAGKGGRKTARVTNLSEAPIMVKDVTFQTTDATGAAVLQDSGVMGPAVSIPVGERADVVLGFNLHPDAPAGAEVAGSVLLTVE